MSTLREQLTDLLDSTERLLNSTDQIKEIRSASVRLKQLQGAIEGIPDGTETMQQVRVAVKAYVEADEVEVVDEEIVGEIEAAQVVTIKDGSIDIAPSLNGVE